VSRIFATRPLANNPAWTTQLLAEQFSVQELPLLEIVALDGASEQIAKTKILDLDNYQILIFVSQNAVEYGMEYVDRYWPQLPSEQQWLAIGSKTASALRSRLIAIDPVQAEASLATAPSMTSESLLTLPQLHAVKDKKVLIFRGLGGRGMLAEALSERGATVHYCELYSRGIPEKSTRIFAQVNFTDMDIVPVFSGESLGNFVALAKQYDLTHKHSSKLNEILQVHVLVPSERVLGEAQALGFTQIAVAENASEQAMLDALKQHK